MKAITSLPAPSTSPPNPERNRDSKHRSDRVTAWAFYFLMAATVLGLLAMLGVALFPF